MPSFSIAAAVAAVLSTVQPAFAQEASADEGLSEVVVTGSRIVRRDYNSDSPVVTVSSDALTNTSEVGVEQALNKMPQFVPGQNQFSDAGSITVTPRTSPGIATANLRGLGANRTLVLLDGRRTQPANASMVVDLNTIPSAAIDNIEIITGGAGSTYGADAVSGVVNFKLKRNFQGITTDAQFGMTERGDGEQTAVSALLGSNFAEGKGNAMIGITYTRREQVIREDVPFFEAALSDPYLAAQQFLNFPGFVAGVPGNITGSQAGGSPTQDAVNAVFGPKGYAANDVLNTSAFYWNQASTTNGATLFALNQGRIDGKLSPGYQGGLYPRRQVRHLERQHRREDAHDQQPGWHAAGAADPVLAVHQHALRGHRPRRSVCAGELRREHDVHPVRRLRAGRQPVGRDRSLRHGYLRAVG
ncbi:MAG: TonB-dependent receptor plug domain-containing protein [Gammaproteobacteria bacterium]